MNNSDCICSIPKDKHLCSYKCELCKGEIFCEFEYGHPGDHLCNKENICEGICQQDGICEININRNITKTHINILEKNKKKIKYEEKSEQNCKRKKCQKIIPKGKKYHEGKHKCQTSIHKCGFLCKQCERMCELEFGHNSPHYCQHGHIKNASIFTDENDAQIIFQNNEYDFQNNESINMFTCYQYCREQRRGHIHLIDITKIKKIENLNLQEHINKKNIKLRNDNICECRCEFFWKIFLNFNFDDEFYLKQKEEFNKCPTICKLCLDNNKKTKYCQLDLWHEPVSISSNNDIWISKEGHVFDCKHPIPCHSIFIIDKFSSMGRNDLTPLLPKIRSHQNFNNRLGKLIEILDNYIKVRNKINNEDIFSLITFSDEANIIFQDINYNSNKDFDLIDLCLKTIICKGESEFYRGFIEGEKILSNINRKKYKPVIILFSDGADQNMNETKKIFKRVSIFFYSYNFIINFIDDEN